MDTQIDRIPINRIGEILKFKSSVSFIPNRLIKRMRKIWIKYMTKIKDNGQPNDWLRYFLLPTILLESQVSSSKEIKIFIQSRLKLLEEDDWSKFTVGTMGMKVPFQTQRAGTVDKTVIRYAQAGEISKASEALIRGRTYIEPNDQVVQRLREKHPDQNPQNTAALKKAIDDFKLDDSHPPILASIESVRKILYDSKNLIRPGLDKMRYEHLRFLYGVKDPDSVGSPEIEEFQYLYVDIINKIIEGNVPQAVSALFRDTELFAVAKGTDDIRPIGMGCMDRKIASIVCQKHSLVRNFNKKHFKDTQCCLQKLGCEKIIHAFREALSAHPERDTFAMDASNAFNSCNRQICLLQIKMHFPSLLPMMRMIYGQQSNAWIHCNQDGVKAIASKEGSHQGCVHGMWMYAMGLQPFVERIQSLAREGFTKFYADDGNINANFDDMIKLIEYIKREGPKFGYNINLSKGTYLLGRTGDPAVAAARRDQLIAAGIKEDIIKIHPDDDPQASARYGCKILGSYIGSDEYVKQGLQKKIDDDLKREAELLCEFPNQQVKFLILKWSLCQKANFIFRTTPPPLVQDFIHHFTALKRNVLASILKFPNNNIPDIIWEQACLNVSDGGLGLQDAMQVSKGAYVASVAECAEFVDGVFPGYKDNIKDPGHNTGHLMTECLRDINSIVTGAADYGGGTYKLIKFEDIDNALETLDKSEGTLQCYLNNWHKEARIKKFEQDLVQSPEDHCRLAWFVSLRCSFAGKWLDTCPKTDKFTLSNTLFISALRYRLMLEQPTVSPGSRCTCSRRPVIDSLGHHLATHCGKDGFRNKTHDSVVLVLKEMLNRASLVTRREELGCFREADPNSNERPDLSVLNFPEMRKLVIDVQVTCPVPGDKSLTKAQAATPSRAANAAYQRKKSKYADLCDANNLEFLPFIIESTGRLHGEADKFFKKVVSIMSDNSAVHQSVLSAYWQSRLSMCLQSQISQAIVTRAQHINSGRCNQNNYDFSLSFISSFPTLG